MRTAAVLICGTALIVTDHFAWLGVTLIVLALVAVVADA